MYEFNLLDRGYKEKTINSNLNAVPDRNTIFKSIFKSILLKNKTIDVTTKDFGTPVVITYTPALQASLDAIKRAIVITEEAKLDPHYPLIFSASNTHYY